MSNTQLLIINFIMNIIRHWCCMLLIFSLPTSSRRYCTGSFRNYVGKENEISYHYLSFRTYLYNSIRNASLNYLKHQNVEISLSLNVWQALIEKSQKKKIPMKKKYTDYFFALSIIYQHVAGKYSYCTWMGKK